MKTSLSRFLALVMVAAMILTPFRNDQAAARGTSPYKQNPVQFTDSGKKVNPEEAFIEDFVKSDSSTTYIIQLEDAPLASYKGGVSGLAATSPDATGEKLNVNSPNSVAYINYLDTQQALAVESITALTKHSVETIFKYKYAFNGFAIKLSSEEAAQVAKLPGVMAVEAEKIYPLDTDAGPTWIGAPGIWKGTTTGGLPATQGEGIIVGIIDTGINSDHPSFADIGGDGYNHTNPLGAGKYRGVCDPTSTVYTSTGFVCNDKIIGAWDFVYKTIQSGQKDYPTPEDENGHGSHTASTVAGNVVTATVTTAYDRTEVLTTTVISGVAPHANIIAYDACYENIATGTGSCPNTATLASVDQAVADGVDVINYSIGGGTDPYSDSIEKAFLAAFNVGVYVAASAGNDGPVATTVEHRSPWVSTTAASTHNRVYSYATKLANMKGGASTPPPDINGRSITGQYGPAPIVYAGDYGDARCLNAFPAHTWKQGEIVVCDRGSNALVNKVDNVKAGGAGGAVIANVQGGATTVLDIAYSLPTVHIDAASADALRAWLDYHVVFLPIVAKNSIMTNITATTPTTSTIPSWMPTATIQASSVIKDVDPANGDIMADFSSRGPNVALDILKPDIAAPGVAILAAVQSPVPGQGLPEYEFYQGTSMASPHNAGAAALMMALHPTWSPAQIKSAFMMTSVTNLLKEDGVTPATNFDMGAGRLALNGAGRAGLVMDETTTNFTNADPTSGGDPRTLNIASMYTSECLGQCTWNRTVESVASGVVTWTIEVTATTGVTLTVTPSSFSIAPGATQALTITANVVGLPAGEWVSGLVQLIPDNANVPSAHLPVVAQTTSAILPGAVVIATRSNNGSQVESGFKAIEITDLTIETFGLAKATQTTANRAQDPTEDNPFDNLNGSLFITTTVPANTGRLVAEIAETTSLDIDLYIGIDVNGDGLPQEAELYCMSATPAVLEYCDVPYPDAGTYWVLAQNFKESSASPDAITLATAVVPTTDAANLAINGPSSIPVATSFALTFTWNIPTMMAGDRWYGAFTVGTDAGNPANLTDYIPVDLIRYPNDVTKTVNSQTAVVNDILTYTITIQPDVTPVDLNYVLTDTIPAGLSYVTNSAVASSGVVNVTGNTLTWNGTVSSKVPALVEEDLGGYLEISGFSSALNLCDYDSTGQCDDRAFSFNVDFYYLGDHYTNLYAVSNGYINPGKTLTAYTANPNMPDPTPPNNLIAPWWTDLDMDGTASNDPGGGKWYYAELTDGTNDYFVLEWQNAELYDGPTSTYSFQLWIKYGTDEIWFTYDHLTGDTSTATVGFENGDGTVGQSYYYNGTGSLPSNAIDLAISKVFAPPITITYQVKAISAGVQTNYVEWITDNPGALLSTIGVPVTVTNTIR